MRSKRILTLAEIAKMKEQKTKTAFERKLVKDIRRVLSMSGDRKRIPDGDYIDDRDIKRHFIEEHDYWKNQKLTEEEFDYAWDKACDMNDFMSGMTKIQRKMFEAGRQEPNC